MKAGLVLPAAAEGPRRARRFLSETLVEWGRPDLVERCALAVSELVTNAFLHGKGDITLLVILGDALRVEVHDGSPLPPKLRHYSAMSATGRGLHLLGQLVDRWGSNEGAASKSVWFEVDAPLAKPGLGGARTGEVGETRETGRNESGQGDDDRRPAGWTAA